MRGIKDHKIREGEWVRKKKRGGRGMERREEEKGRQPVFLVDLVTKPSSADNSEPKINRTLP